MTEIDQLLAAAEATQKLHKKLRQLCNRGDCTEADLADAAHAVAAVRAIYARHGIKAPDVGGTLKYGDERIKKRLN